MNFAKTILLHLTKKPFTRARYDHKGVLPSSIYPLTRCFSEKNQPASGEKNKLRKPTTPAGKLDEDETLPEHPHAEKDPLPPWPGGVNPHTGEKGGPRGPEPTRYGDWERKGRVSDF